MRPSHPEPTPEADAKGGRIERRLYRLLCQKKASGEIDGFCQPDSIVIKNRDVYFVEAKAQEHYTPPPFAGHGLPAKQADNYMALYEITGIRTRLIIWDLEKTYYQWLDVLERDERHFDTAGTTKTPRRIYPLDLFETANNRIEP